MKASLAVSALSNAAALRNPAGTVVHSGRGSQFRSRKFVNALLVNGLRGSMGRVGAAGDNAAMESFFRCCKRMFSTGSAGAPVRNSGWRLWCGSKEPITVNGGSAAWANSLL